MLAKVFLTPNLLVKASSVNSSPFSISGLILVVSSFAILFLNNLVPPLISPVEIKLVPNAPIDTNAVLLGSNFSLIPISFSVVCAAISAAAKPTASTAPTVVEVVSICFVLILLDNDAKVSGSVIISFATSFPTCFCVYFLIASPAAF